MNLNFFILLVLVFISKTAWCKTAYEKALEQNPSGTSLQIENLIIV